MQPQKSTKTNLYFIQDNKMIIPFDSIWRELSNGIKIGHINAIWNFRNLKKKINLEDFGDFLIIEEISMLYHSIYML